MYTHYAPFYDASLFHFSVLMYGYIRDILRTHEPVQPQGQWIDLACGTGTLAIMLADDGWDILGIDLARAMLQQARKKVRESPKNVSIRFRRADIRDWSVSQPVDVVSCCFDSINYLLHEDDLQATFACVYRALKPGGLWLFDINTPYFLEHIWGTIEVEDREQYTHLMQTTFDAEQCLSAMTLTGFVQQPDGYYEQFIEQHIERGYSADVIRSLLENTGFQIEAWYDCFTLSQPPQQSQRWFWVARKPT